MATEYKLSYTAADIDVKLGKIDNAVLSTAQNLTEAQKAQARENIGAMSEEDLFLKNLLRGVRWWLGFYYDTGSKETRPEACYFYTGSCDPISVTPGDKFTLVYTTPAVHANDTEMWLALNEFNADGSYKNRVKYEHASTSCKVVADKAVYTIEYVVPEGVSSVSVTARSFARGGVFNAEPDASDADVAILADMVSLNSTSELEDRLLPVVSAEDNGKVLTVYGGKWATRSTEDIYENPKMSYRPKLKDGNYNVLAINHRGFSEVAPENTIPAYILSKEKGFNYVECDVSFTADGVAVLLHDDTIDRTSDGTGSVSAMTYEDLLAYDFGSWKSEDYAGTKIATFDEFLYTCRGLGLHPYIELKSGTEAQITELVNTVKKYGMQGNVTYISFSASCLEYVKNVDQTARLGYIVWSITDETIETAKALQTSGNEVFIDAYYSQNDDAAIELCMNAGIAVEVWTVNWDMEILALHPYISGVTSDFLIAGEVLEANCMVYNPPSLSIAAQWEKNGSANIANELVAGVINAPTPPYTNGLYNRFSYVGEALTVSGGDVISFSCDGDYKWAVRCLNAWNASQISAGGNVWPDDTGWLSTNEYTVPDDVVLIWLTFARTDDKEFTAAEMGSVIISKQ